MNTVQDVVEARIAAAIARLIALADAAEECARTADAAATAARMGYRAAPGADAELTMAEATMRADIAHQYVWDAHDEVQAALDARAFVEAALAAQED